MKYTITVTNPTKYFLSLLPQSFLDIIDLEGWKTFQVMFVGGDYTQWIKDIVKKILDNANCEVYVIEG